MLLGSSATDFAARGLRDRPGLNQYDLVGWGSHNQRDGISRALFEQFPFGGFDLCGFGQHDNPLRPGVRVRDAECSRCAFSKSLNLTDRLFELMRINVLAGSNNDVFYPAGNKYIAARHICPIAAIEPAVP